MQEEKNQEKKQKSILNKKTTKNGGRKWVKKEKRKISFPGWGGRWSISLWGHSITFKCLGDRGGSWWLEKDKCHTYLQEGQEGWSGDRQLSQLTSIPGKAAKQIPAHRQKGDWKQPVWTCQSLTMSMIAACDAVSSFCGSRVWLMLFPWQ